MRIYRGDEELSRFEGSSVVSVGSFDGIHLGHRAIISSLIERARAIGAQSTIVTFEPHPRITLGRAEGLELLSSFDERMEVFASLGVDTVVVLEFTAKFSQQSCEEFVVNYLLSKLKMKELVVGFNNHMGFNQGGDFEHLQQLASKHGFGLFQQSELKLSENNVSSTTIREAVREAKMEIVEQLLNRRYTLYGTIDKPGIFTLDQERKLLPADGRYEVMVNGEQDVLTIENQKILSVEHAREGKMKIEIIRRIER